VRMVTWWQWVVFVAGSGGIVWSTYDRIAQRQKFNLEQKAAALAKDEKLADRSYQEHHDLVESLQAERTSKNEEIARKDAAIESRNAEIVQWKELSGKSKEIIAHKNLEIFLYRRERRELLEAAQELEQDLKALEVAAREAKWNDNEIRDCTQLVAMMVAKLTHDIEIPFENL